MLIQCCAQRHAWSHIKNPAICAGLAPRQRHLTEAFFITATWF
jgi:hypothetical protein